MSNVIRIFPPSPPPPRHRRLLGVMLVLLGLGGAVLVPTLVDFLTHAP